MNELEKALDTFENLLNTHAKHSRLILLHPDTPYRTLLPIKLYQEQRTKSFYYACTPNDVSLGAFLENIAKQMAHQHTTFGQYLNKLPQDYFNNASKYQNELFDVLRQELTAISESPFYLFITHFDLCNTRHDITQFLQGLVNYLPPHSTLVLSGRDIPRLSWLALIAKKQASILTNSYSLTENFYGNLGTTTPRIQALAFQYGQVLVNNELTESWEGHLPRLLLFFTLEYPTVTRAEICRSFWQELEEDQAVNVFHVTKRRMNKALHADVLAFDNHAYRVPVSASISYDAMQFVESLAKARHAVQNNEKTAVEYWQHAINLYQAPFLDGYYEQWIVTSRQAFRDGYQEALSQLAHLWAVEPNKQEQAIRIYARILEEDYANDVAHQGLLSLYALLGRRLEAIKHYQKLEATFQTLQLPIPDTLKALYSTITQ